MEELIKEVRSEFQIPPFFPDEGLLNYAKEGLARLSGLNPYADFEEDLICRSLLKNYVYYAYHHHVDDWERNYRDLIISWQMGGKAHDTSTNL